MKIEIDLDDVFRDENGNNEETLQETIQRQIVARLTEDYRKKLFASFDSKLSAIMQNQIADVMKTRMPEFIDDILNAKYTPVSSYGTRGEPTTFRDEIIKSIAANMEYKPKQYSSDENAFTRAVKSIVEQKTASIKEAISKEVNDQFKRDALTYAVAELSKRLGLPK